MTFPYGPLVDVLEEGEDPLLSWGVVDGGYSDEEVLERIDGWLASQAPLEDAQEVLQDLKRRGLVFRDDSAAPPRWRTRSAEAMRLLLRLRQLFPAHDQDAAPNAWRRGGNLVADFRFIRRPRSFPRRDLVSTDVIHDLEGLDSLQRNVLTKLTMTEIGPTSLSGFQVRSLAQITSDLTAGRPRGVVVGAGTGSGKTLAFYLPAFAHLAHLHNQSHWTRVIAIYPRNELLRDQLTAAFATARRLDEVLRSANGRPIRMGAYLGLTPQSPRSVEQGFGEWPAERGGRKCPYLSCPGDGLNICGGDLIWHDDDRALGNEALVCAACARRFDKDVIALTRQGMAQAPPDLLFGTAEMLNRSLSDLAAGRVFGIGTDSPPHLMLLDEIHTYQGNSGAQTAMVLRRWRHRVRRPVTFVGLSATLQDPTRFFSELVGLPQDAITAVEPESDELMYEGAEYLLAARSDPTSGAGVLSTTIQTSMLVGRVLDTREHRSSNGLYGTRMFVFTDDLDVTNRLYSDVLDAEGYVLDARGRPNPRRASLATLREPSLDQSAARRAAGQSWELPEILGHSLAPGERLTLGRTSSQDVGVDRSAQVIVATASLEVGFDDPEVGAILQHKAPRGNAQFVQRMGRAGRPRGMRPWSIVVLSDYGRDRQAYAAWDALFDPVIPSTRLPIRNRHILRMQATQCLLDWVAERLRPQLPKLAMWRDVSRPPYEGRFRASQEELQRAVSSELEALLSDRSRQAEVTRWISRALQVPIAEVNELLWYPPRAVLLAAVPTLLRRLSTGWARAERGMVTPAGDRIGSSPLPDFFPSNLFSELSLPEVQVRTPPQTRADTEPDFQPMDITQGTREFSPGRVSRRFVTRNTYQRHWVPAPLDGHTLNVTDVYPDHEIVALINVPIGNAPNQLELVRPFIIATEVVPDDVRDSSNSELEWRSEFVEQGDGIRIEFPIENSVGSILRAATFHLHADQSNIEARRGAIGVEGSTVLRDGQESRFRAQFVSADGRPVAVGVVHDVDALRLDVALPNDLIAQEAMSSGVRSAWFRHLVEEDPRLRAEANVFQLGWVHDAAVVALIRQAVSHGSSLEDAFDAISSTFREEVERTLEVLFQRVGLMVEMEDVAAGPTRLRGTLTALLSNPPFLAALLELLPQLWTQSHADVGPWLQRRLLTTVGEAVISAARVLCPDHDPDGLLLDVEPGLSLGHPRTGQVWVSEATVGGGGFLEALVVRMRSDPHQFLSLVRRMVRAGDSELLDQRLQRFLTHIEDPQLQSALVSFRTAANQTSRVKALQELRRTLRATDIGDDHAVVSAIANRLLRPGSNAEMDRVIGGVVQRWIEEEERLGIEIDVRTWAYLESERAELDVLLVGSTGGELRQRRLDALNSVLWPRGWQSRAAGFRTWNPFSNPPDAAPEVLRTFFARISPLQIDVGDPDVAGSVRRELAASGEVVVIGSTGQRHLAADLLVELLTNPIDLDFLQVHPKLVEVEITASGFRLQLELPELWP